MHIELNEHHAQFREKLRKYIAANRPDMLRLPGTRSPRPSDVPAFKQWCASLFEGGFVGHDWPIESGGSGTPDPIKDYVVDLELADAGVPRPIGAYSLVAHALLDHGSESQKSYYLPRIRSFTDLWCQLFSEPDAGSDLAALRTRAVLDGDEWVITGQKVWTTHGHVSDFGFLLARTDTDVVKQAGISAFVVDMRASGVEVRPLREVTGSSDFNEVFFDGVRIPKDAMIGAPGEGWQIAKTALAHERAGSLREDNVVDSSMRLVELLAGLSDAERADVGGDADRRLGELAARARATDLLGLRGVLRAAGGTNTPVDAAITKVVFSETNLALATLGIEMQGARGIMQHPDSAMDDGHWQEAFLWARGFTISAGSNEIMRNLIAESGVGLPREVMPVQTGGTP